MPAGSLQEWAEGPGNKDSYRYASDDRNNLFISHAVKSYRQLTHRFGCAHGLAVIPHYSCQMPCLDRLLTSSRQQFKTRPCFPDHTNVPARPAVIVFFCLESRAHHRGILAANRRPRVLGSDPDTECTYMEASTALDIILIGVGVLRAPVGRRGPESSDGRRVCPGLKVLQLAVVSLSPLFRGGRRVKQDSDTPNRQLIRTERTAKPTCVGESAQVDTFYYWQFLFFYFFLVRTYMKLRAFNFFHVNAFVEHLIFTSWSVLLHLQLLSIICRRVKLSLILWVSDLSENVIY